MKCQELIPDPWTLAKIAKCSADTALRDIKDLLSRELLSQEKAGGRSTAYTLQSSSLKNKNLRPN